MPKAKSKITVYNEVSFEAGYTKGLNVSKKLIDNILMHNPSKVKFIERIAFLFGGEYEVYSRLHREIINDIDRSIDNLTNDLP